MKSKKTSKDFNKHKATSKVETIKPSPSKKSNVTKVKAKKVAPKKSKPAKKAAPKKVNGPSKENKRVYHVAKREDGMWQVRFAGGEKAIKLFKTKVEAEEYTKQMAKNQKGVMLKHNSKGANKGKIAKK